MSNNKQSSVDFLFQNMFELSQTLVTSGETQYELMMQVYQQAKAMHKEEKKQVLKDYFAWHKSKGFVSHKKEDIEEFINETFEGNNED